MKFRVNELRKLPNLHVKRDLDRNRKIKDFRSESGKFTQIWQKVSRKAINKKIFVRIDP